MLPISSILPLTIHPEVRLGASKSFWLMSEGHRPYNKSGLFHKQHRILGILKIIPGLLVKFHQFWSDFDVLAHFGIWMSRGVHWYPYRANLVTSKFRPPVLWGQSFGGREHGWEDPEGAQIWYATSVRVPTAMVPRRTSNSNIHQIGPTLPCNASILTCSIFKEPSPSRCRATYLFCDVKEFMNYTHCALCSVTSVWLRYGAKVTWVEVTASLVSSFKLRSGLRVSNIKFITLASAAICSEMV